MRHKDVSLMAMRHYTPEEQLNAFWSKVIITADDNQCWTWIARCNKGGYGTIHWHNKSWLAHRVSWTLPNYIIPEGLLILHSCDNPSCVNPKHLFLGTYQDNMDDMKNKQRSNKLRGEGHGRSILTTMQVKEIRQRYKAGGVYYRELAAEYNVSLALIAHIVKNMIWTNVNE